jgi:hypothetical protein
MNAAELLFETVDPQNLHDLVGHRGAIHSASELIAKGIRIPAAFENGVVRAYDPAVGPPNFEGKRFRLNADRVGDHAQALGRIVDADQLCRGDSYEIERLIHRGLITEVSSPAPAASSPPRPPGPPPGQRTFTPGDTL